MLLESTAEELSIDGGHLAWTTLRGVDASHSSSQPKRSAVGTLLHRSKSCPCPKKDSATLQFAVEVALSSHTSPSARGTVGGSPTAGAEILQVGEQGLAVSEASGLKGCTVGGHIRNGSFGTVHKAMDRRGEFVAVKTTDMRDEVKKAHLNNEIHIMKRLRHPNIVKCLGSGIVDNKLCMYLEYMHKGSMDDILAEFGPLHAYPLKKGATEILRALDYLHSQRPPIVHRDVKSANILVDTKFTVKLADFGLSKQLRRTRLFTSVGTPRWMAPEVIESRPHEYGYGQKADIWSFGCTLLEMSTAEKPWGEIEFDNQWAMVRYISKSSAVPDIPESVPRWCRELIQLCLRRADAERPGAEELLRTIDVFRCSGLWRCVGACSRMLSRGASDL